MAYGKTARELVKVAQANIKAASLKYSFVDTQTAATGSGTAAPPPGDPAAAGGGAPPPPMDPAMMDPSQMGGGSAAPPPGDPMADPAAAGGGGTSGVGVEAKLDKLIQLMEAGATAGGGGAGGAGAKGKPKPLEEDVARLKHMMAGVVDFLKIPISATGMVDPTGAGAPAPGEQGSGSGPVQTGTPAEAGAQIMAAGGGGGAPPPAQPKAAFDFAGTAARGGALAILLGKQSILAND